MYDCAFEDPHDVDDAIYGRDGLRKRGLICVFLHFLILMIAQAAIAVHAMEVFLGALIFVVGTSHFSFLMRRKLVDITFNIKPLHIPIIILKNPKGQSNIISKTHLQDGNFSEAYLHLFSGIWEPNMLMWLHEWYAIGPKNYIL
ncbi:hypothetical protein ACJX0J_038892 [Zea mays]